MNASIGDTDMCIYEFLRSTGSATNAAEHRSDHSEKQSARSHAEKFELTRAPPVHHLFQETSSDDVSNDIEVGEDDASYNIEVDDNNPSDDVIAPNEISSENVNFVRQWMTHADAAPVQHAYCSTSNPAARAYSDSDSSNRNTTMYYYSGDNTSTSIVNYASGLGKLFAPTTLFSINFTNRLKKINNTQAVLSRYSS